MIQFKKILYRKSVILLLLFLATINGFLQDDRNEYRTRMTKKDSRLFMDRSLEHSQNLPTRKIDIDRQVNQKDRVAERLYDRRSFRTGTIERNFERGDNVQNRERSIDSSRLSRDVRTDVRDVNNNLRDASRTSSSNRQNMLRENRQVRDNRLDRRVTERAVNRFRSNPEDSTTRQVRSDLRERLSTVQGRGIEETRYFKDLRQYRDRQTDRRESRNGQLENSLSVTDRRSDERDVERRFRETVPVRRSDDRRFAVRSAISQDARAFERRNFSQNLERRNSREINSSDRQEIRQNSIVNSQRNVGRQDNNDRIRSLESRRYITRSVEARDRRLTDVTLDRSRMSLRQGSAEHRGRSFERHSRENSFENRSLDHRITDRRSRQNRIIREDRAKYVPIQSRSDSTRNIRDIHFRDNRDRKLQDNRVSYRRDFTRESREDRRDNNYNRQRRSLTSRDANTRQIMDTNRYNPLAVDSRRSLERLDARRTYRDSVRSFQSATVDAERNVDEMKMKVNSNIWANTAKVLLAVFLIGQIVANSSKANKFRFHNAIMSMVSSVKSKVQ